MDLNQAAPYFAAAVVLIALMWPSVKARLRPPPAAVPVAQQQQQQQQPTIVVNVPPQAAPAANRPLLRDAVDAIEDAAKDRYAMELAERWTLADATRRRKQAAADLTEPDIAPASSPTPPAPTPAAPAAPAPAPSSTK